MSVDYKITIVRKNDKKKIASFYFNRLKNLGYSCASRILDSVSYDSRHPTTLSVEQLEADMSKVEVEIENILSKIFETKLMMIAVKHESIKRSFESDINQLEEDLHDVKLAYNAYNGLLAVISCLVEDLIVKEEDEGDVLAYEANAEDLKSDDPTHLHSLWMSDVDVQIIACN
jgi:hypothetical protein